MKRFLRFVPLVALFMLVGTPAFAAVANPDYITIEDIYAFRNVLETGDQLYFVRYDVSYNATPNEDASETYQMVLYDVGEATLIHSEPLKYYQHNIISMYFSAAKVTEHGLVWGSAYVVKIRGNPVKFDSLTEGINMRTRTLGGDFKEASVLGTIMLGQAQKLQDDWAGITLLTTGGLLNTTGAYTFEKAIPNLHIMVPEIYSSVLVYPTVERRVWTRAYEESLQAHAGSRLTNSMTSIGSIFGISEGWTSFWLGGVIFLVVVGVMYGATKNPGMSMIMAYPVLVGYAWLGLGSSWLQIVGITFLIVGIMFGIYFILQRFA